MGIAVTSEGRFQRDGSHVEGTRLGGWVALIHILYGLALVASVGHRDVNLQVGKGLQRCLYLKVFGVAGGGRCGNVVGTEQPAAFLGLVDV